jgi:hypothetical protein
MPLILAHPSIIPDIRSIRNEADIIANMTVEISRAIVHLNLPA